MLYPTSGNRVALVIDNTVKIYGSANEILYRPLLKSKTFDNYGQALAYANEFDHKERSLNGIK